MRGKTVSLGRDLNPIAVRVKNHAFIVPISGMARAIENRETVVFEPLRQCIDLLLRTHGERDMGQAHPLDPGSMATGASAVVFMTSMRAPSVKLRKHDSKPLAELT